MLEKTWHNFISGFLGGVHVAGSSGSYSSSMDLLLSKSTVQKLPFLDFLKEPLTLFTKADNLNMLLGYLENVFRHRCVLVESPGSGIRKILVCSSHISGFDITALHFAVVITLNQHYKENGDECCIELIRNLGLIHDGQQEALVNKVVDVILAILVDAEPTK